MFISKMKKLNQEFHNENLFSYLLPVQNSRIIPTVGSMFLSRLFNKTGIALLPSCFKGWLSVLINAVLSLFLRKVY